MPAPVAPEVLQMLSGRGADSGMSAEGAAPLLRDFLRERFYRGAYGARRAARCCRVPAASALFAPPPPSRHVFMPPHYLHFDMLFLSIRQPRRQTPLMPAALPPAPAEPAQRGLPHGRQAALRAVKICSSAACFPESPTPDAPPAARGWCTAQAVQEHYSRIRVFTRRTGHATTPFFGCMLMPASLAARASSPLPYCCRAGCARLAIEARRSVRKAQPIDNIPGRN